MDLYKLNDNMEIHGSITASGEL